jgi:hypothetical protein
VSLGAGAFCAKAANDATKNAIKSKVRFMAGIFLFNYNE